MSERMAKRRARPTHTPWPYWRVMWRFALHGLIILGLTVAIVRGLDYLHHPNTLAIRNVLIEGEIRYQSRSELTEVMAPLVSGGFFSLNLDELEQALRALPWVYAATVRRIWPDQVVVHITEEVAVAYWGRDALMTQYGEIIMPAVSSFPPGLPHLQGNDGRHRVLMNRYLAVQARLADIDLEVVGLYEDARRAWRIEFADGMQVMMGRRVDQASVERLVRMYPHIRAHREQPLKHIDLRYTNGAAVAWLNDTERPLPR